MFAAMPALEALWPHIEAVSREELHLPYVLTDRERTALALHTARIGVDLIKEFAQASRKSIVEVRLAQGIIPKKDDLDRILRYETATDRSLSRALDRLHRSLDRLERLQSRRRANGSRGSEPPDDSLPGDGKIPA